MITAIIIMLVLELLQLISEYGKFKETGVTINQFRIIQYMLPFTIILTVFILLVMRKNKLVEKI